MFKAVGAELEEDDNLELDQDRAYSYSDTSTIMGPYHSKYHRTDLGDIPSSIKGYHANRNPTGSGNMATNSEAKIIEDSPSDLMASLVSASKSAWRPNNSTVASSSSKRDYRAADRLGFMPEATMSANGTDSKKSSSSLSSSFSKSKGSTAAVAAGGGAATIPFYLPPLEPPHLAVNEWFSWLLCRSVSEFADSGPDSDSCDSHTAYSSSSDSKWDLLDAKYGRGEGIGQYYVVNRLASTSSSQWLSNHLNNLKSNGICDGRWSRLASSNRFKENTNTATSKHKQQHIPSRKEGSCEVPATSALSPREMITEGWLPFFDAEQNICTWANILTLRREPYLQIRLPSAGELYHTGAWY